MTAVTAARSTCPDAITAFRKLLSPRGDQDPFPLYTTLRELAPVLANPPFLPGGVVLSRHQDCSAALRNRALHPISGGISSCSSDERSAAAELTSQWLLTQHGPRHAYLRGLVAGHFGRDRCNGLRRFVEDLADDYLEGLAEAARAHRSVDLVEALLLPFPLSIIGHIIGIPDAAAQSLAWAGRSASEAVEQLKSPAQLRRIDGAAADLGQFFTDALRRRPVGSRNDLLSSFARQPGSDNAAEEQELVSNLSFVFTAGFDSSTSLLGTAVRALLEHPRQAAMLREGSVAPRIAVAELLRYDPPVHMTMRAAHEPTCVGGEDVPAGGLVWLLLGSANRDPELVDRPDQLDITRTPVPNLSFSAGPHFCVGAHLAMMEAEVLLPRLLRRFPEMALAGRPRYRSPGTALRGIDHLPVVLRPAT